jgi:hypothetical protein
MIKKEKNMISITNISKRMAQCSLMLILFLAQSVVSSAQVKLYMEDFAIANGETKTVSLILDNDKEATVLQAKIDLPYGLEYVDESVAKTDRFQRGSGTVQVSEITDPLVIVETGGTIAAGEGAVITFQVTRTTPIDGDFVISLSELIVSDADGNQLNTEEEMEVNVKFLGLQDCKFAAVQNSVEMMEDDEFQFDITLTNEGVSNLTAFQGKLTLPEGLEIVPGEDGQFIYSDRTPSPLQFTFKEFDGYTTFVLSSSSQITKITGTSGTIFSFKVKATKTIESGVIKLEDLYVSAETGQSAKCEDVNIDIKVTVNPQTEALKKLKAEADAAIEDLRKQLSDVEATIKGYEYVKDAYDQEIADLNNKIDATAFAFALAFDDKTLNAEEVEAAIAELEGAITELSEKAADAEETYKTANKPSIEAIYSDAETAIELAKAEIDEKFGEYAPSSTYENKFNQLAKELVDAKAALDNVDFTDIDKAIEALETAKDLVAQQEATILDIKSTAAYKAQKATIEGVENEANAITYNEDLYTINDLKSIKAQQKDIADAIAEVKQAIEDNLMSEETSPYAENDNIMAAIEDINEKIADLKQFIIENAMTQEGDVNMDGVVDIFDIQYVISKLNTDDAQADVNKDGIVDIFDIQLVIKNLTK